MLCVVCCVRGHILAGYAVCLLSSYMSYGLSPTGDVIGVGELEKISRSLPAHQTE